MEIVIEGDRIRTERDFHEVFSASLGIGQYYGNNLHALWDVLSASVERPVTLIWKKSNESKHCLGGDFEAIVDVFRRVEIQDEKFGWIDKFSFILD
jgi:ribonuclease inhibitor